MQIRWSSRPAAMATVSTLQIDDSNEDDGKKRGRTRVEELAGRKGWKERAWGKGRTKLAKVIICV